MNPSEDDTQDDSDCPECGAPAGSPCDPRCPNAEGSEPDRYDEGVSFDRFMDRILTEERGQRIMRTVDDSPQRKRQAARQERPLGRIRMGVK